MIKRNYPEMARTIEQMVKNQSLQDARATMIVRKRLTPAEVVKLDIAISKLKLKTGRQRLVENAFGY